MIPLKECQKIMQNILSKKISDIFDDFEGNPSISFYNIQKKLNNNQYSTVAQWKADVEKFYADFLQENLDNYLGYQIVKELREKFRDQAQVVSDNPERDWATQLCLYEMQIKELLKEMPISLKPRNRHPKRKTKILEDLRARRRAKPFTEEDMIKLQNDIHFLTNNADIAKVHRCIIENEEKIKPGEDIELSLNNMKPATLNAIRSLLDAL